MLQKLVYDIQNELISAELEDTNACFEHTNVSTKGINHSLVTTNWIWNLNQIFGWNFVLN